MKFTDSIIIYCKEQCAVAQLGRAPTGGRWFKSNRHFILIGDEMTYREKLLEDLKNQIKSRQDIIYWYAKDQRYELAHEYQIRKSELEMVIELIHHSPE